MRFFSKIANSRFVFSDGQEAFFMRGFLDMDAKHFPGTYMHSSKDHPNNGKPKHVVYEQELNDVLGRNPMIYVAPEGTTKIQVEELPKVDIPAKSEAEIALQDSQLRGVAGNTQQEVGPLSANAGLPTDANASTVDPALKAAMFAGNPGQEMQTEQAGNVAPAPDAAATRLAEIRAAAAVSSVSK